MEGKRREGDKVDGKKEIRMGKRKYRREKGNMEGKKELYGGEKENMNGREREDKRNGVRSRK